MTNPLRGLYTFDILSVTYTTDDFTGLYSRCNVSVRRSQLTVNHMAKILELSGFHSAAQKLVLIEISYRADRKGIIRYSQSEIAAATTLARPTVATWFAAFEESGLLKRLGHGRYQLNMSLIDELDEEDEAHGPWFLKYEPPPSPAARAEAIRLNSEITPTQVVVWGKRGAKTWPEVREITPNGIQRLDP